MKPESRKFRLTMKASSRNEEELINLLAFLPTNVMRKCSSSEIAVLVQLIGQRKPDKGKQWAIKLGGIFHDKWIPASMNLTRFLSMIKHRF